MRAWYYYRGALQVIEGEHPAPVSAVFKGHARIRYHEDSGILAVQARSRRICRQAVDLVLDRTDVKPDRINAEWPGVFIDVAIGERWR